MSPLSKITAVPKQDATEIFISASRLEGGREGGEREREKKKERELMKWNLPEAVNVRLLQVSLKAHQL